MYIYYDILSDSLRYCHISYNIETSLAVRSHCCWQRHRGHGQTLQSEECTASQNTDKRRGTEKLNEEIELSNEKNPGWLGNIGDYTIYIGIIINHNKPL